MRAASFGQTAHATLAPEIPMARRFNERPTSIRAMLTEYTVAQLKSLGEYLLAQVKRYDLKTVQRALPAGALSLPTRKADLVDFVAAPLEHSEALREVYEHLNTLEKAAVQEATHTPDGTFDAFMCTAKYGRAPQTSLRSSYGMLFSGKATPGISMLALFFASGTMLPPDLQQRFAQFVPPPKGATAQTLDELPDTVPVRRYGAEGDAAVPLEQHATEQAALQDVMAVLQLVDAGKVAVSAKTSRVTKGGANAIRRVLSHGDFYPETLAPRYDWDVKIGDAGIRPFAWGMLAQAANLAQINGSKLALSRTGQAALKKPPQEVIAKLWQRWLKTKLLHELNRVEIIKGQKSKSRPLAAAETCRQSLAGALSELEPGAWVELGRFFTFLIAQGYNFEAARNLWELYLFDKQYGSLGYDNVSWKVVNGRFARAFLLEYAATLGIIDVALIPPWDADRDFGELWGADDTSCLSRYDGLYAIRLTPLGAWVLGQRDTYEPAIRREASLTVSPDLEVTLLESANSASDALFLDRCCEPTFKYVWRITLPKLLEAVEEGVELPRIVDFFQERVEDALPQAAQDFFKDAAQRVTKVQDRGTARLVECADAATATRILADKRLKAVCFLAGDRHIAVPLEQEALFRKTVRSLGYVLPGPTA